MTEIPELQIARLQLRDGDILVARTRLMLDHQTHAAIERRVRASLGDAVRVLVHDRTFELSVLSPARPAEPVEAEEWRQAMDGLPAEPWIASEQVGVPGHGIMAQVFIGGDEESAACLEMTADPKSANRLAAWFALCRPSRIAALLDRLAAAGLVHAPSIPTCGDIAPMGDDLANPSPAEAGGVDAVERLTKLDDARISIWKNYGHLASREIALLNEVYDDLATDLALSSLSPAATPGSEAGGAMGPGHVCEHGIRWPWACDDCDRAALAKPSPAGGDVREALTAEDVLRELASSLGVGGYEIEFKPEKFGDRIRDGIEQLTAPMRDGWRRYLKLRSIGAAPNGTLHLQKGLVMVATNLDKWLDEYLEKGRPPAPSHAVEFAALSSPAAPEPAETISQLAEELGCENNAATVFRSALSLAKRTAAPEPALAGARVTVEMIDRAMVVMKNLHPPIRRSECERLLRAAIDPGQNGDA